MQSKLYGTKLCRFCDLGSLVLLCVIMADCSIFGAGRMIMLGPISFRMAVLAMLLILSFPLIVVQFSRLIKSPYTWFLAAFAVMLMIATALGIYNQNSKTIMMTDLKGFAYFSAFLPAICVLRDRKRIHMLMNVMLYASAMLSLISIITLCLSHFAPQLYREFYCIGLERKMSAFALLATSVPRLFFNSSMYLVCGCAFSIYFQVIGSDKKIRIRYILITGIALFSLLLTYTRSIYLATFVAAGMLVVLLIFNSRRVQLWKLGVHIALSVVVLVLLLGVFRMITGADYFKSAVERLGVTTTTVTGEESSSTGEESSSTGEESSSTGEESSSTGASEQMAKSEEEEAEAPLEVPDTQEKRQDEVLDEYLRQTEDSDALRMRTKQELLQNIYQSPIIGNGLGVALESRNFENNEYIYYDFWAKMGLVGLFLYFLPFLFMVIQLFRKRGNMEILVPWFATLLGFIVFSYFNPYMNAALGILFYCCAMAVFQFIGESNYDIQEDDASASDKQRINVLWRKDR